MGEKKHELYKNSQEILKIFENRYGSLRCGALLNLKEKHSGPKPSERDHSFFDKRPCPELIGGAAEILESFLKERSLIK